MIALLMLGAIGLLALRFVSGDATVAEQILLALLPFALVGHLIGGIEGWRRLSGD